MREFCEKYMPGATVQIKALSSSGQVLDTRHEVIPPKNATRQQVHLEEMKDPISDALQPAIYS